MHQPLPAATLPRELRPYLDLVNQVFEVEKKATALTESHSLLRNVRNMRAWLEKEIRVSINSEPAIASFTFHSPLGESYDETRSDCDASIAGAGTTNLMVTEVIKPIIWFAFTGASKTIVQQAVVVVESQSMVPAAGEESIITTAEAAEPVMVPGSSFIFKTVAESKNTEAAGQQSIPEAGGQASENSPQTPV